MLKKVAAGKIAAFGARFGIVASEYNAAYVDSMLRSARAELKRAGAAEIRVIRVPGAYEIPVVAARLAWAEYEIDAVICLGVILRGATTHAQHIGEAVSNALAQIQVQTGVPIIHEVLLLENEQQARERCLDPKRNRGREAAQTALKMAVIMRKLNKNRR
jgi:6,7-dimethyl-8-ribityllumazine synthase